MSNLLVKGLGCAIFLFFLRMMPDISDSTSSRFGYAQYHVSRANNTMGGPFFGQVFAPPHMYPFTDKLDARRLRTSWKGVCFVDFRQAMPLSGRETKAKNCLSCSTVWRIFTRTRNKTRKLPQMCGRSVEGP